MGNLGTPELLVVLLIALLVLGPTRLPDAARSIGKGIAEFRRVTSGFETEVRDAMSSFETEVKSAANPFADSAPETPKPYVFEPPPTEPSPHLFPPLAAEPPPTDDAESGTA